MLFHSEKFLGWWVGSGGIAIIESASGPDLETRDGAEIEMILTCPGQGLDPSLTKSYLNTCHCILTYLQFIFKPSSLKTLRQC